jgi:chemotaxis signal transduction protein
VLVDRAVRVTLDERFELLPLPAFVAPAGLWFAGILQGGSVSCLLLSPDGLQPGGAPRPAAHAAAPDRPRVTHGRPEGAEILVMFRSAALPSCSGSRYGLGSRRVGAVVQTLPSIGLPGAPTFVTAVSWWQGAAVPLIDFSERGHGVSCSRYLLVRTRDGEYAGLPVEPDVALHRVTADAPQVSGRGAPFVAGLFTVGEERVALLDVDALLATGAHVLASCAG